MAVEVGVCVSGGTAAGVSAPQPEMAVNTTIAATAGQMRCRASNQVVRVFRKHTL